MRVKKGVNPYGMRVIEITEIDSTKDEEREKVAEEIKKWLSSK